MPDHGSSGPVFGNPRALDPAATPDRSRWAPAWAKPRAVGLRLHVRSLWASGSDVDAVFEFDQTRITIGRGRGADVRLPHRSVSLRHATIEHRRGGYVVVDHGTTNGTRVQGSRIVPGRDKPLRDGDRIELGGFSLVFR